MTTERDIRNQIAFAEKKGIKKGEARGERNRSIAIAREMLSDGLPADMVSKYTGLTCEEIQALT
ncbi:MAG: hypothetical protein IJV01_00505 [Bacteroidales bacterium]|nr:hypothetical protein [Bacteroidales bacterium]